VTRLWEYGRGQRICKVTHREATKGTKRTCGHVPKKLAVSIRVRFGVCHGRTQSSGRFWRPVEMTSRSVFIRKKKILKKGRPRCKPNKAFLILAGPGRVCGLCRWVALLKISNSPLNLWAWPWLLLAPVELWNSSHQLTPRSWKTGKRMWSNSKLRGAAVSLGVLRSTNRKWSLLAAKRREASTHQVSRSSCSYIN